ncbi:MAG: hypothetical protein P1P80_07150, partial [ANME-2 cluster archaeon]|nr:hypothetical protein [ANME-2 cluster archaeon]
IHSNELQILLNLIARDTLLIDSDLQYIPGREVLKPAFCIEQRYRTYTPPGIQFFMVTPAGRLYGILIYLQLIYSYN